LIAGLAFVESNTVQWGVVIGASLAAALIDLRIRKIPNRLTLPLAATGFAFAALSGGWAGAGDSLAGFLALLLPFFALFALKGTGAGDAKMMGAIGAWLGLRSGIVVLLAVAIAGGVLSLLRMLVDRQRGRWFGEAFSAIYVTIVGLCGGRQGLALLKSSPQEAEAMKEQSLTIAYGPAIFIGVCIGAWVVNGWKP
jgi:prepilin peptidase CpaA